MDMGSIGMGSIRMGIIGMGSIGIGSIGMGITSLDDVASAIAAEVAAERGEQGALVDANILDLACESSRRASSGRRCTTAKAGQGSLARSGLVGGRMTVPARTPWQRCVAQGPHDPVWSGPHLYEVAVFDARSLTAELPGLGVVWCRNQSKPHKPHMAHDGGHANNE